MTLKPVVWLGDSLARLRRFPREATREAGYQLERVQSGREPNDWKPMPSIGAGVIQKKSQRTARLDIELARSRFRSLVSERTP